MYRPRRPAYGYRHNPRKPGKAVAARAGECNYPGVKGSKCARVLCTDADCVFFYAPLPGAKTIGFWAHAPKGSSAGDLDLLVRASEELGEKVARATGSVLSPKELKPAGNKVRIRFAANSAAKIKAVIAAMKEALGKKMLEAPAKDRVFCGAGVGKRRKAGERGHLCHARAYAPAGSTGKVEAMDVDEMLTLGPGAAPAKKARKGGKKVKKNPRRGMAAYYAPRGRRHNPKRRTPPRDPHTGLFLKRHNPRRRSRRY